MEIRYTNSNEHEVTVLLAHNERGVWYVISAEVDDGEFVPNTYSALKARDELIKHNIFPKAVSSVFIYNVMAADGITHLGSMCSEYPLGTLVQDAHEYCIDDAQTKYGNGAIMTDFKQM